MSLASLNASGIQVSNPALYAAIVDVNQQIQSLTLQLQNLSNAALEAQIVSINNQIASINATIVTINASLTSLTTQVNSYGLVLINGGLGIQLNHSVPLSIPGGQIQFPAVDNPSANVNTLDDYEEGRWTPVDGSGAGLTFTYSFGQSSYTKIGSLVICNIDMVYPATGNGANAVIAGLPFTLDAGKVRQGAIIGITGGTYIFSVINPGANSFNMINFTGVVFTNAALSGATLLGTIVYNTTL